MRRQRCLTIAAALVVLLGGGWAQAAEPLKIRLAWVIVPGSFGPILFPKPDMAKHLGKSYSYEPIYFAGTALEIPALAASEIDIANLSFSAIGSAISRAHIDDLRVFADEIQDGINGYRNDSGFLVLKDGSIKTVDDLKGKVLAVNAVGGAMDMALRAMARRHNLEDKRDYAIIEAQFPNMKSILLDRKADMIATAPPFSFDPELRAKSLVLFRPSDAFGPIQLTAWTARAGYLEKNRAVLTDFMEDVLRSVRWYTDPANHQEAVKVVADYMKQPPERLDWLFTEKDDYRDPNGLPNLDALQSNLKTQKEVGFLEADIDIRKYADLSIVTAAAARLK